MLIVRINKDGSMNDIEIQKLTNKNLINKLKKHITTNCFDDSIKELYYWNYEENIIKCYGWYQGEYGFENKHELIPNGNSKFLEEDSSEKLLFGDIFIICFQNDKIINFNVSDYALLYDQLFENFDNCSDEDNETDDNESEKSDTSDDSLNEFINDNETSSEENYNEILDYDLNEYNDDNDDNDE